MAPQTKSFMRSAPKDYSMSPCRSGLHAAAPSSPHRSKKGNRSREGEGCFLLVGDEDGVENGSTGLEKETDLEEEKDVFYCREMKMGSRMALRL